jgi:hypothetical protein
MVIPTALDAVDSLMGNSPKCFDLRDSLVSVIPLPSVHQLCFMCVIRHRLREIPPECASQFTALNARWRVHIQSIRETLPPPAIFAPGRTTSRAQALLTQKLWAGIAHLKRFDQVTFERALDVVLDALGSLDELTHSDDLDSSIIQRAVAFSECPNLLPRFMLINVFVMKHPAFRAISTAGTNLVLWLRFECAVLKLLQRDNALMEEYWALQDEAALFRPAFGSHARRDAPRTHNTIERDQWPPAPHIAPAVISGIT